MNIFNHFKNIHSDVNADNIFEFNCYRKLYDTVFKQPSLTFNKDGEGFNLSVFKDVEVDSVDYCALKRFKSNVEYVQALILDYDGGATISEVREKLKDFNHFGYTSYNHLISEKHNFREKFRVVLPLEVNATPDEIDERKKALLEYFTGCDTSTFMISRVFYLPNCHPDNAHLFQSWENLDTGKNIDFRDFEVTVPVVVEYTQIPVKVNSSASATILGLLQQLPKLKYNDYQSLIYSMRNLGYSEYECLSIGTHSKEDGGANCRHLYKQSGKSGDLRNIRAILNKYFINYDKSLFEYNSIDYDTDYKLDDFKSAISGKSRRKFIKTEEIDLRDVVLHTQNNRYLDVRDVDFNDTGLFLVKSAKGTGKTEFLKDIVKKNKQSSLVITHRVSLSDSFSTRLGMTNYKVKHIDTPDYVVQLDSLEKRVKSTKVNTIILDEVNQLLNHFLADTIKNVTNSVFTKFVKLLKNADRIIAMDADLNTHTIDQLLNLINRDDLKIHGIINEFKSGFNRDVVLYSNKDMILTKLISDLKSGNNAFIAVNARSFSVELADIIRENGINDILVINSETVDKSEVMAFINNPAAEAEKYQVVIASPSISTGVSIDGKHFNSVFGIFTEGNILSATDRDQAISRVRNTDAEINVFMSTSIDMSDKEIEFNSEFNSRFQNYKNLEIATRRMTYSDYPQLIELNDAERDWLTFYVRETIERDCNLINIRDKFKFLLEDNGFSVTEINDKIKFETDVVGKSNKQKRIADVIAADDLVYDNDYQLKQIIGKLQESTKHDDKIKLMRHNIMEFSSEYNTEFTDDFIADVIDLNMFKVAGKLKTINRTEIDNIEKDKKNRLGEKAFTACKHNTQFKGKVNEAATILNTTVNDLIEGKVKVNRDAIDKLCDWYKSDLKINNLIFGGNIGRGKNVKGVTVWNLVFGGFGVLIRKVGKNGGDKFEIDVKTYELLLKRGKIVDNKNDIVNKSDKLSPQEILRQIKRG